MRSDKLKRTIDVVGASAGLVLSMPLLVGVGALVRVTLGKPVLFRQQRPGLGGKPFEMLKFRTMKNASGPDGAPLPDELRLTALGKLLRSTSVDELPELINVLRGEMSLVGPRPLLMEYLDRYDATERRRHEVKPGITGWTQIHGRNALDWKRKFELDVWYVDHWTNGLDLTILLSTLRAVLGRKGISHEGAATMPVFQGSRGPASAKDAETAPDGPHRIH